jgi:hypothetical protein
LYEISVKSKSEDQQQSFDWNQNEEKAEIDEEGYINK